MTIAPFYHMGLPKTSDVFLYLFMDGPMVMQMVRAKETSYMMELSKDCSLNA